MIKKKKDIHIDVNRLDKMNLFKVPFVNDKVPNITEQIEKRLKYVKKEKEKLLEEDKKYNFIFDIPFNKTKKKTFKRKTKKTLKIRTSTLENYKKQILDINQPINNNFEKSIYSHSEGIIDDKKFNILLNKNKQENKLKNQNKFRNSAFFITEEKQKSSLLHLTSNF